MKDVEFGFTAKQIIEEGRVAQADIDQVRLWLPSIDVKEMTDEQLTLFLLSCSNDIEATKKTITAYLHVARTCPELASNRTTERDDIKALLEIGEFAIFPERTDDGCAVLFARLKDTDYRKIDMGPALVLLGMTMDAALYDHPPTGLVVILDMKGATLMHMTRLKVRLLKIFFDFLQEALPVQMKRVHMLNTVFFIDKLMAIVKPFISKKVMDLLHFHPSSTDMEVFAKECVPKRCLPEDYGGTLPPVSVLHQASTDKLKQMQPFFDRLEQQRLTNCK